MDAANSILRAIAYFDVFRYPVTAGEIFLFMDRPISHAALCAELDHLLETKKIFRLGEYYSLQNEPGLEQRRILGNNRAMGLLLTAHRIGRTLYKFPFVRGVGISGSLSKNYADPDADIDYFIITSKNHLWIARTFLHALKKLSFLAGKQHWFCMNYFVDEEALLIAEKNVFTATEVVTLKPVCGAKGLQSFYNANLWAIDYFPNHAPIAFAETRRKPFLVKSFLEKLMNNRLGNSIDNALMRITAKRWAKKEENHQLNSKGNPLALIAGKHFARPNPEHFQKKIMNSVEERIQRIENDVLSNESSAHFFRSEIM
ncbi:hypothetical protein GWC95_11885 [Sediminibacterium roseum]|uniref:Nucleotidyltransferase domain-containing protein n=1 Tax=Sediminibacterium roseum TaxID=1978412 RepID=A0ABW9ZU06_9BACT|nr:hypothetical protein [Sediminibacterium roseum]NCI50628.1 hypothetical protein [Sediminibacterium roseum]